MNIILSISILSIRNLARFLSHLTVSERWMDGWMDGWVDGWMDGWMDDLQFRLNIFIRFFIYIHNTIYP